MTSQWEAQVVGINYYPNYTTLQQLTAAAKDAEAIASQLEQYGYQTFRVQRLPKQENQKGEWQINPDEGVRIPELRESISNLLAPPDDNPPETALFFFSGHGWRKKIDGKDEVFLATSDVFPDEKIYGIAISELGQLIQASPVKKLIVWLDCCYSGELIKYLPTNKDYCIFTATRSYEPGIEIKHQEGLFTQTLREGLNPHNYPDGMVDSHKLAKFIQERMAQTGQAPQCFNSERSILLTTRIRPKLFRDKCPYRSLSYFTEKPKDAQVFYGRTKLTQELVKQVRDKQRLIAVFGASGSGKSSLIRAGLLYQLKLGQEIAGSNNWVYCEPFTPTDQPLARLSEVLGDIPQKPPSPASDQTPIILIIDQFEECFTMGAEETRKAFIECLTGLIETRPNLQLIIGMRSDFRGRLREYPQFSQNMSKLNVGHLNREEIQEAIEKPAEWVGLGIEGSLKQQLINDVEDYPGSLPLLQYTLTQLWNEARKQGEQFLRLETYEQLGGIEGTLEKRADAVYESLSPEEQTVAKRIFLELTQVGDTLDTRRRVRLGDLVNSHHSLQILDTVTQKLASDKNRLITRTEVDKAEDTDESKILIDVVHEALIRHWKRLGDWKQQYQAAMVIERKIEALAKEWQEQGDKKDYLLQRDRLVVAENYLNEFGILGMLDGLAEEFIKISREEDEKAHQEAEKRKKEYTITVQQLKKAETERDDFQAYNELDLKPRNNLEKFNSQQIEALISTIKIGKRLQEIVKDGRLLKDYPAVSPLRELQEILDRIQERNRLEGHLEPVTSAEFSPNDDKLIVTVSQEKIARLWNIYGELITSLQGHQALVKMAQFSPDGKFILTASEDKTACLWDISGQKIICFQGHLEPVNSAQFSPDGKLIVTASDDKTARLWDISGKMITTLRGHQASVKMAQFSPDGKKIVTAAADETAKIWDILDRELVVFRVTLTGHQDLLISAKFNHDGQLIVTTSKDRTARLWDILGKEIAQLKEHKSQVTKAEFSRDSKLLVTASDDGTARLWEISGEIPDKIVVKEKSILRGSDQGESVTSAQISPDNQKIITTSKDGTARLWDTSGQELAILRGHKFSVWSAQFSHNGQWIVTASQDKTARLWDVSDKDVMTLQGHQSSLNSAQFDGDGKRIVTASDDRTAKLWDLSGKELLTLKGHEASVTSAQFSHDGQQIITTSADGTIRLWETSSGKPLKSWEGHKREHHLWGRNWVRSAQFSPDSRWIVTASDDGTAIIWDVLSGQKLQVLQGHQSWVRSAQFSPDSRWIVTASDDGTAIIWDVFSGQKLQVLQKHQSPVMSANFSFDSELLVTTSYDGTALVWNTSKWGVVATLKEELSKGKFKKYQIPILNAHFSQKSQLIATASSDGLVKVWDIHGRWGSHERKVATFRRHQSSVSSVQFSPDGKYIVTASADKTAKILTVETLDNLLERGHQWLRDYLNNNINVNEEDKRL